jgi:hypothetical protein
VSPTREAKLRVPYEGGQGNARPLWNLRKNTHKKKLIKRWKKQHRFITNGFLLN